MARLNRTLLQGIRGDVLSHWEQYREPMAMRDVSRKFAYYIAGQRMFFVTWMREARIQGHFHIHRTRTGAQWVFAADVWDGLTPEEQMDFVVALERRQWLSEQSGKKTGRKRKPPAPKPFFENSELPEEHAAREMPKNFFFSVPKKS